MQEEIFMAAFEQNPQAIEFMNESIRDNEDYCFEFVRMDGRCLRFCSPEIRKNKDIIVESVLQNP